MSPQRPDAPPLRAPTPTARRIATQLQLRLERHAASGDAFVVSIYGEWGIGKTRCLEGIQAIFDERLGSALDALAVGGEAPSLVVPVFFDPWQYEHEDHLVVPLLKTIERALVGVGRRLDPALAAGVPQTGSPASRAQAAGRVLHEAAQVFGDVAVSLLTGFKFKFAPLKELTGIEMDFAPKDVFEAARKAEDKRAASKAAPTPWYRRWMGAADGPTDDAGADAHQRLAQRESLYFDVRGALAALTAARDEDGTPALRLLLLIDDLDRCLPDKAIQVLESVKLFLNVPGFSFVLAVDDEVVERGIAHRYSSYRTGVGSDGAWAAPPISGAEYLEKIVHLPVHLQRWTRDEATRFLRGAYPNVFGGPTDAGGPGAPRADELLALVLGAIPLVPRKLIRLAEALDFQWTQFHDMGARELWHPIHAARIVALQQLYPALYRHLRLRASRYWRLFTLVRDDFGEPSLVGGESMHQMRERFSRRTSAGTGAATPSQAESLRENLSLLQMVDEAGHQRGSPDPLDLFPATTAPGERREASVRSDLTLEQFAQLYFHGVALAASTAKPGAASAAEAARAEAIDADAWVERLVYADEIGRREFLQSVGMPARLPDAVFERLSSALQKQPERLADIDWLRDIGAAMDAEQLLRLYQSHGVLDVYNTREKESEG